MCVLFIHIYTKTTYLYDGFVTVNSFGLIYIYMLETRLFWLFLEIRYLSKYIEGADEMIDNICNPTIHANLWLRTIMVTTVDGVTIVV